MAYSFQTFSVNQILTSSQMNQVEVNIRDHAHGASSVNQTVGAAPTSSGHYANKGYVDQFLRAQAAYAPGFVFGRIDTSGTSGSILTGSGFSIGSKISTGKCLVIFTTSFSALPTFGCAAETDAAGVAGVASLISAGRFITALANASGPVALDGIYSFSAMGLR